MTPTYAYIGIFDGVCTALKADHGDVDTANFAADVIRRGGCVERVPVDVGMRALSEPWPQRGNVNDD